MMQIYNGTVPNVFEELFYSLEIWGVLGALAMVIVAWYITKKDRHLGVAVYIVMLFMTLYFYLPEGNTYLLQVFIMVFGGALVCIVPQFNKG